MKYQSELIKDIQEARGHEKSSLHYESECIEEWIEESKGSYPKLRDYQSEWLNYINENPTGMFPYEIITDVTEATVNNVVPFAYQSAILKGNTKYRDIDTGDILDTFDETKNLELVSVQMPVLKTVGKNLFNGNIIENSVTKIVVLENIECISTSPLNSLNSIVEFEHPIKLDDGIVISFVAKIPSYLMIKPIFEDDTLGGGVGTWNAIDNWTKLSFRIPSNSKKIKGFTCISGSTGIKTYIQKETVQIEQGTQETPYEPYKSNILTVNEDVTLRSNGDVYDELNLLTGRLTQRIDENNEVLAQEVVKTVDLTVIDQDGNTLSRIKPIEGTMHIHSDGTPLKPSITMEIPVEALTQNLASFIKEE